MSLEVNYDGGTAKNANKTKTIDTSEGSIVRLFPGDKKEDVEYGQLYFGRVNGVQPYGVFVTLARHNDFTKEISGLAHRKNLSIVSTLDEFAVGDKVVVELLEVDEDDRLDLGIHAILDKQHNVDLGDIPESQPSSRPLTIKERPVLRKFTGYEDPATSKGVRRRADIDERVTLDINGEEVDPSGRTFGDAIGEDLQNVLSEASSTDEPNDSESGPAAPATDADADADAADETGERDESADAEGDEIEGDEEGAGRNPNPADFDVGDDVNGWIYCGTSQLAEESVTSDGLNGRVDIDAAVKAYNLDEEDKVLLRVLRADDPSRKVVIVRPVHADCRRTTIPQDSRQDLALELGDAVAVFGRRAPDDAEINGTYHERSSGYHVDSRASPTARRYSLGDGAEQSVLVQTDADDAETVGEVSVADGDGDAAVEPVEEAAAAAVEADDETADREDPDDAESSEEPVAEPEDDEADEDDESDAAAGDDTHAERVRRAGRVSGVFDEADANHSINALVGEGSSFVHFSRSKDSATLCGESISDMREEFGGVRRFAPEEASHPALTVCENCDRLREFNAMSNVEVADGIRDLVGLPSRPQGGLNKAEKLQVYAYLLDVRDDAEAGEEGV